MGKRKTPINWKTYNKELVQRGRNLGKLFKSYSNHNPECELKKMNDGKRGKPYRYSNTTVMLIAVLKTITGQGYRLTEGLSHLLFGQAPSYSHLSRRVNQLPTALLEGVNRNTIQACLKGKGPIEVIMDATGVMVNKTFVWRQDGKGEKRERDWKKLHIVIDRKTKALLSVRVIGRHDSECKDFKKALGDAMGNTPEDMRITRAYGDGGYDSYGNFELCHDLGIDPVIRIRQPSIAVARSVRRAVNPRRMKRYVHLRRNREALNQIDWKEYVKNEGFGLRGGVEGVIGSLKKTFGESFASRKDHSIRTEALLRMFTWNLMVAP